MLTAPPELLARMDMMKAQHEAVVMRNRLASEPSPEELALRVELDSMYGEAKEILDRKLSFSTYDTVSVPASAGSVAGVGSKTPH